MLDNSDDISIFLDRLCPFHLQIAEGGRITHIGPTLLKILPHALGAQFADVFVLRKPIGLSNDAIAGLHGQSLEISTANGLKLIGVAMPLSGLSVVNLSFGMHSVQAVERFGLTIEDFAPTDQTLGMLYLHEAKAMALGEYKRLSSRLHGAKLRAETQANTDALTGLFNLRALRDELAQISGADSAFALLTLDLDHFKAVNDTLGHAAGDYVLKEAAKILREETRTEDVVARNGGDEFTILLKGVSDRQSVIDIGNRIIARLEEPMQLESATCHISASIGTIFSADFPANDIETLFANADKALYGSKRAGRGRNTVYSAQ